MRTSDITRETNETKIQVKINLDGSGMREISTSIGFLDHMLELFSAHSLFDLKITVAGDTQVDFHHSVEDAGITLGMAILSALGDKVGIERYGDKLILMDYARATVAVDLSGREALVFKGKLESKIGDFDSELVEEFFLGLSRGLKCNLFVEMKGKNSHHKVEAAFKALARALKEGVKITSTVLPSSKGVL